MAFPRSVLVLLEPSIVAHVARYLTHPKKRDSLALDLASAASSPRESVALASAIAARLNGVVSLRDQAIASLEDSDSEKYAVALWREVAGLAISGNKPLEQGFGRSLGLLAHSERHAFAYAQPATRHLNRAIRHLLSSTAVIAPELAMPGWERALPAWGGEGLASGCIPREFVSWFAQLLSGEHWPLEPLASELFGPRAAAEWRISTLRLALTAERRGAHLLELDSSVLRARIEPKTRNSDIRALLTTAA